MYIDTVEDIAYPLWHKNPSPGGHEIYNFGRPFFSHHYSIFYICPLHARV